MFVRSYLETAAHLADIYQLQMPLNLYLKAFFRNNPKYGSRDRRIISELLFGMYRLGPQSENLSATECCLAGSFLSGRLPSLFLKKPIGPYTKIIIIPF